MIGIMVLPIVFGLILALILPSFFQESKVDLCLDNGGSFNYEKCVCDFKNNHKVIEQVVKVHSAASCSAGRVFQRAPWQGVKLT